MQSDSFTRLVYLLSKTIELVFSAVLQQWLAASLSPCLSAGTNVCLRCLCSTRKCGIRQI